jgi:hypothetical protein
MQQITEWKGHRKLKTALFLDRKNSTSHEFLTPEESEKKKSPPLEPTSTFINPAPPPPVPAPTAEETSPAPCLKTNSADEVEDVTDDASTNLENSCTVEDTSGELAPQVESYDDWTPAAEDWFSATIDFWAPGFLFASLSNDEKVFCSKSTFTNKPHQHDCNNIIRAGDAVQVRMERGNRPNPRDPKWAAIETVFLEDYILNEEEAVTIVWWKPDKDIGVVERDCGCRTFVAAPTPYDWRQGDDAVISGWEKSRHPEHPGEIATKIRIMQSTIPLETIHPMGTFNPSEDEPDGLIRI